MIKLVTRKEITRNRKIISSELAGWQKIFYDEDLLQDYKDSNEEHLFWEQFDFLKEETIDYDAYRKIIGLNHTDINTFTQTLTGKLKALFDITGTKDFIVLAYLKLDFFGGTDNPFPPLANAYRLLKQKTGQQTYKEAFVFGPEDLADFVEILFWITRCDPGVAEYILVFDQAENLQLHLCKYGNIHLTEFKTEKLTEDLLQTLGWTIIEGPEYDPFSEDGSIEGRQINPGM